MELAERQKREGADFDAMAARQQRSDRAHTLSGARKPGETDSGSDLYKRPNVNMGTDGEQKNPLNMIINAAKNSFNSGFGGGGGNSGPK